MAPAYLLPLAGKTFTILKAASLSSFAVSFHAFDGGSGGVDDGGDFIGHGDPHSLEDHDHGAHGDHADHADHGEHGHDDHEHGLDEEHEHGHDDGHGEQEDHEDLDHEREGEEPEPMEEEMEAHADELEVEAQAAAPGLAGQQGTSPAANRGFSLNKKQNVAGSHPIGKSAEGMAPAVGKVVKSVAAASIVVSAVSRLVEERSKELGIAPWCALSFACTGPLPRSAQKGPLRRAAEMEERRKKEHIPATVRHAEFVM